MTASLKWQCISRCHHSPGCRQALFNIILEIITVWVSNWGNVCIHFFSSYIQRYMALYGNSTCLSRIPSPTPTWIASSPNWTVIRLKVHLWLLKQNSSICGSTVSQKNAYLVLLIKVSQYILRHTFYSRSQCKGARVSPDAHFMNLDECLLTNDLFSPPGSSLNNPLAPNAVAKLYFHWGL